MASLDMLFSLNSRIQPLNGRSEPSRSTSQEPDTSRYPKRKRAQVKYYTEGEDGDDSTDSETECVPLKRAKSTRPTKPLPPQKIFPFTSLPAELRNRIYEECFPEMPTLSAQAREGEQGTIWFRAKQKAYRRSVEQFFPDEEEIERTEYASSRCYGMGRRLQRGQRGRVVPPTEDDEEDEEEMAGKPADKRLGLNILALNKAIYDEAAPMVYGQRLVFADTVALMSFASMLSPRTAKLIRHIEVCSWNLTRSRKSIPFTAMAILAAKGVTDLETLSISCEIGWFSSWSRNDNRCTPVPKRVARKVYRDCFLWLEAVGRESLLKGESRWKGVDALVISEDNMGISRRRHAPPGETAKEAQEELNKADEMFRKELKRLLREKLG
ncbi:hypothetical protein K504DRAFT_494372 [Pleomassaria siparia CBS 279.74]|uniref:Uncharacterized protein n=1 Tax=Pleomassaria siparia CBS 279.74 TaxID=1314801 RepID=A0A6G1JWJ9_9PLEO|nr:hypothetical protein K504DRAFT_494372 [Pleomassaria siparia CBS 279.74]